MVAHQLDPIADVATDGFFQGPQLLACLFADEEPVIHEWILAEAAPPGERPLPCRSKAIGESANLFTPKPTQRLKEDSVDRKFAAGAQARNRLQVRS